MARELPCVTLSGESGMFHNLGTFTSVVFVTTPTILTEHWTVTHSESILGDMFTSCALVERSSAAAIQARRQEATAMVDQRLIWARRKLCEEGI